MRMFIKPVLCGWLVLLCRASTASASGPAWDFIFSGSSFSQLNQGAPNIGMGLVIAGPSTGTGTFVTPDGLVSGQVARAERGSGTGESFNNFAQFQALDSAPSGVSWTLNAVTTVGSGQYQFLPDFSGIAIPQVTITSPIHDTTTSNLPTFQWTATGSGGTVVQVSNADFSVNINQLLVPGQTSFTVPTALPPGDYNFYLEMSLPTTNLPVKMTRISGPDLNIVPNGTFSFLSEAYDHFTVASAPIRQWNLASDGSWGTASNWAGGVIPDAAGASASFAGDSVAAQITLDGNRTLGTLSFSGTNAVTLAPGSGGNLILNNQGLNVSVNVTGHQQINVPVQAQDNSTFSLGSDSSIGLIDNASLLLAKGISVAAGKTITKADVGTLSTAFVSGGSLHVQGGNLIMIPNGTAASTSHVEGLSVDSGATLDLTDNALVVSNSSLDIITPLVQTGFAGGAWNGSGITSSLAAVDASHLTAVGLIQNNQDGSPLYTSLHSFHGYAPNVDDILLAHTYYGDANLDGKVDGSDYSLIDAGFLSLTSGWLNGDFNYDAVIDGSDYALIDNAFNQQGAALTGQRAELVAGNSIEPAAQSVPEPASIGLIAVTVLLGRRRKRVGVANVICLHIPAVRA